MVCILFDLQIGFIVLVLCGRPPRLVILKTHLEHYSFYQHVLFTTPTKSRQNLLQFEILFLVGVWDLLLFHTGPPYLPSQSWKPWPPLRRGDFLQYFGEHLQGTALKELLGAPISPHYWCLHVLCPLPSLTPKPGRGPLWAFNCVAWELSDQRDVASQCPCGWRVSPGWPKIGRRFGGTDERGFPKSYGWCLVYLVFSNSGFTLCPLVGRWGGRAFSSSSLLGFI